MDESIRNGEREQAVRNVAIIGHPAAGVTELTNKILNRDETPVKEILSDVILFD